MTAMTAFNAAGSGDTRLAFFDNLRTTSIALVIVHHAAQAYGPTGGWWPIKETPPAAILGPFLAVNRSFGMSLVFFIAGYFAALSNGHTGIRAFLKSRWQRLGIPLIVYSLLTALLQVYVFAPLATGQRGAPWPVDVGHFWFVQHLLLYSVGYALWVHFRRVPSQPLARPSPPPRTVAYRRILAFAACLALATAIIRTWYDIDEWTYLLGYWRVAFADLPRDLSLFIAGTLAYRHEWVMRFPSRAGRRWLAVGLALGAAWYAYEWWLSDVVVLSDAVWGLLYPLWESLLCCSLCIGLTVWFRDKVNAHGPLARELSRSSYAAFMVHIFVVFLFQFLALRLAAPPLLKFGLVSLFAVVASFGLASLIRRPLRL